MKTCAKCKVLKSVNEFHRLQQGVQNVCKDCMKKYYFENKDRLREKVKCGICEKLVVKTYLEKHKNDIHRGIRRKFKCECGKSVYDLKQHSTKNIHTNYMNKFFS